MLSANTKSHSPGFSRITIATVLSIRFLIITASAERTATYWNSVSGDFYEFSNWSLGMPSNGIDARIDNGGVVRITSEGDQPVSYVYLGSRQNTSGTLEISGNGTANFTTMIVGGLNSTGTLTISGGGRLTTFGGPIGSDYLSVGIATVDGLASSWNITGPEMVIGGNSTGNLYVQNNSSVTVANGTGRIQLGNHPLSSGNLYIGNGGIAGTIHADEIFNGEGQATVIFNHTNDSYSFTPRFTGYKTVNGNLNVRHEGTGTTVLTAPENNLAGLLTIAAGTLIVNGSLLGSMRETLEENEYEEMVIVLKKTIGETSILENGTLGGSGFLEGKTAVRGTLSPGMGAGVLKFGNDLSLESTSVLKIEIGGKVRGTQFDGVNVAGTLLYGGTLKITFLDGFVPEDGDSFDLFDGFTSSSGTFADITFSSEGYAGNFDPQTGVLSVATVPEPSVVGLSIVGLIASVFFRRKRSSPNGGGASHASAALGGWKESN